MDNNINSYIRILNCDIKIQYNNNNSFEYQTIYVYYYLYFIAHLIDSIIHYGFMGINKLFVIIYIVHKIYLLYSL